MRSRYDRFVGYLYSHPAMHAGKFRDVIRLTTETAVRALRIPRAEIWLLQGGRLENADTFVRGTAAHVRLPSVDAAGGGRLPEDRSGLPGGPASRGTTRAYFTIHGDGAPAGLLGIVRDGGRTWTEAETSFCVSLAGLAGLAFDSALRRETDGFDRNRVPSMTFRCSPGTLEFEPTAPEGCLELTGHPASAFLQDRKLFFREIVASSDMAKFTSMERTKSGRLLADIFFRGVRRDGESRRFRFRGCRVGNDAGGGTVIEGAITDVTRLCASDRAEAGRERPRSERGVLPEAGRIDMLLLRSPGEEEDTLARDLRRAAGILLSPADRPKEGVKARDDCESCGYDVPAWLYGIVDAAYLRAMERKIRFLANVAPGLPRRLIGNRSDMQRLVAGLLDSVVRLTSGESVLFEVDGESIGGACRLHFRILSAGADDRTNLSVAFSAGRRLLERMGGEMEAEPDSGPGMEFRFGVPQQCGDCEASDPSGASPGKSLLVLHESPFLSNHLKDLCCGLGVQSRFCTTWAEFSRVLSGGRFTHALCSAGAEADVVRLNVLRGSLSERGERSCRFAACADPGPIAGKIPADVVLLVEPLLPEAIACFLDGEYCCAREPEASVVPAVSLPPPAVVLTERPENGLLSRLRALEFLRADRALQRLANDTDLYVSLLEAFREDISRSCDVILRAMQRDDSNALALECHSMKSSLRTIGAESLGEEAERLEAAERNGGAEQRRYFSFIASLEKLASEVDAAFRELSASRENGLEDKLKKFHEALGLFDIQRVRSLADEIALDMGGCGEAQMAELKKHLDLLDYEAADRVIQELMTRKEHS